MSTLIDRLRQGLQTESAEKTQELARELGQLLPADTTLALHGNLGVGKTTFVQGLARGLGITEPVTSPTFNIYTVHRSSKWILLHLDAYRLENAHQADDLLLEEFLVTPWCLAIEWPEKIAGWIPPSALHFEFGISSDQRHTIRLK
jgi:tRNA threonylcarbamoyladenosine biosynthesis protein TsaE